MSNKEKTFGGKLVDAAMAGIPGLIGMGIGAIGQRARDKRQDKRQLEQQQKLMNMQMQGQMGMADYMHKKQMELWRETNYSAQMEELKKAGLNPGLLYGMGGTGGATAAAAGGSVTGGQATVNNGEAAAFAGMGMQAAMTKAQIDLVKAQTKKTEAEVPNVEASTQSLLQGVENAKAQKELTEIQTELGQIEQYVKSKTQNAAVAIIMTELREATARMDILENDKLISDATKDEKIGIIEQELIGVGLRNALTRAQISKTKEETDKIAKELALWAQEIAISKGHLTVAERNAAVAEKLGEYNTSLTREAFQSVSGIVGGIIEARVGRGATKGATQGAQRAVNINLHK